jgi:CDP-diacylglycerol--glycerol-3-phosphate 3-phosphatidyltransferase
MTVTSAAEAPPESDAGDDDAVSIHQERFWNLPNTITVVRTAAVPILLLLPFYSGPRGSYLIAWCFTVAAISDLVDGWLARRGQMVTHIGKLLDPLADKLIVATALIVMVSMSATANADGIERIPGWATWMVVVIVGRELAVTGLRGIASAGGQIMAAAPAGKIKAFVQNVAIAALLFHYPTFGLPAHDIGLALLSLATALTLYSGYMYFASYFRGRNSIESPGGGRT